MAKKIKKVTTTTVTEEIIDEPSNEKTQIICILDRSGSMSEKGIIYESINAFNTFLDEQKKLKDKATLTVALFDDRYELLYDDVDIKEVSKITYEVWTPRGMTALFDAIGKTINTVKANHLRMGSEKPSKVLVCIVTDGKENASKEFTRDGIKKLIKNCENDYWNFIYLAANQNAFDVGSSFGISCGNTFTYDASPQGVAFMNTAMNNATISYRGMSASGANFAMDSKNLINQGDVDENKLGHTGGYATSGNIVISGDTTTNLTGSAQNVTFNNNTVIT
jgi:uncharacterized protein YegL